MSRPEPYVSSVRPEIDPADLRVVTLPMAVRFRGVREREIGLLRGPTGWGEFAPFLEYDDVEASRWAAAAVEAAFLGWPAPARTQVPVNATVPAVPAQQVPEVLARYDGCTTVKVKVAEAGQTLTDDLDRVAAVRDALGSEGRVRVDANGGWSVDQATDALSRLSAYRLEYAEQPCASVADLARVRVELARRGIDVPVAADESIRKAEDPLLVRNAEAADLIVVKVAPLGGVASALRIVEEVGVPAVVSSALDSSVGIRAGVALAAALPELDHACGLGTVGLFTGDIGAPSLTPRGGVLPVGELRVDEELVERYAAPAESTTWWRERFARCLALLH